jgi:hypothetical protein
MDPLDDQKHSHQSAHAAPRTDADSAPKSRRHRNPPKAGHLDESRPLEKVRDAHETVKEFPASALPFWHNSIHYPIE